MFKRRKPTRYEKKQNFKPEVKAVRASRKDFIKKKTTKLKLTVLIISASVLILGGGYILLFSPIFKIRNIVITKINNYDLTSEAELKDLINSAIKRPLGYNLIFFNNNRVANILEKDSRIRSFKINKKMTDTLELNIEEYQPIARLMIPGYEGEYYFNSNGQVITITPKSIQYFTTQDNNKEKNNDLIIFYDQGSANFHNQTYINFIKGILDLIRGNILKQNNIVATIVKINEKGSILEAEITTLEGWKILVNSETDFKKQEESLNLVFKDQLKDRQALDHIDLRFRDLWYLNKQIP
ncbi:MAG: FtsQ-type POTRA domain-containing protein [Patescibacteria group bacterium]|jgi:cell division septal protein FtsQ